MAAEKLPTGAQRARCRKENPVKALTAARLSELRAYAAAAYAQYYAFGRVRFLRDCMVPAHELLALLDATEVPHAD